MPEPAEGPWVAAPIINGFPQHPGEVRGPHGPVAYVSLAVPIEQRHATVSVLALAAGLEMLKALEWAHGQLCPHPQWCEGNHPVLKPRHDTIRATIAKARGETPNA